MQLKKFDSINVIPFIDIMLVLLVIVLTTATFVSKGLIPLDLSTAKNAKKLNKQEDLNIFLKENGNIFFNKDSVLKDDFLASISTYKKNININISCDKNTAFEKFVYVVDILKSKGYTNLGIVTKYE